MRRSPLFVLSTLVLLAGLTCQVEAQPKTAPPKTPRTIEVDPSVLNAAWKVSLSLNAADAIYPLGSEIEVKVTSEQDGYLYLINVNSVGAVSVIFPNPSQRDNVIKAGQTLTIPDPNNKTFRLKAGPPAGPEVLYALVLKQPSTELPLADLTSGAGPRSITAAKLKRVVVLDAMGGDKDKTKISPPPPTTQGDTPQIGVQQEKQQVQQQQGQQQFETKQKQWASAVIQLTTVEVKVKEKEKGDK